MNEMWSFGGRVLRAMLGGRGAHDAASELGATGVWRITNSFVELYGGRCGNEVVLVDAGIDPRGRPIDALLDALGAERNQVHSLLLTHAHPDHVAAVPAFPGARVVLSEEDRGRLEGREKGKGPERWFRRLLPTPPTQRDRRLQGDRWLQGDAFVDLPDGTRLRSLHLPGDTPGARAYLWRKVLIVGDAMDLVNGSLRPAMPFATDDVRQNLRSLAELPARLAGEELEYIATSHGGATPPGQAWTMLRQVAEVAERRLATIFMNRRG